MRALAAVALIAFAAMHPARAQSTTRPPPAPAAPAAQPGAAASAADSALDARTRDLAAQLRCPVCQGLSLQDSPSELSQQMRNIVRQQLAEGRTPDQVKQYFVERYGEWILMAPQPHGFNWMVYVLPFLVLGGGVGLLAIAMRRWTGGARAVAESPTHGGAPGGMP